MDGKRFDELNNSLNMSMYAPSAAYQPRTPLPVYDGDQAMAGIMNSGALKYINTEPEKGVLENIWDYAASGAKAPEGKPADNMTQLMFGLTNFVSDIHKMTAANPVDNLKKIVPEDWKTSVIYADYIGGDDEKRAAIKKIEDYLKVDGNAAAKNPELWQKAMTAVQRIEKLKKIPQMLDKDGRLDMDKVYKEMPYLKKIAEKHGTNGAVMALNSAAELKTVSDVYPTALGRIYGNIETGLKRAYYSTGGQMAGFDALMSGLSNKPMTAKQRANISYYQKKQAELPSLSYNSPGGAVSGIIGSALQNAGLMASSAVAGAMAGIPVMAITKNPVAAGRAANAAGAAVMGIEIAGQQYQENVNKLDKNGRLMYTPRQAALLSLAQGGSEGILEQYALSQILGAVTRRSMAAGLHDVFKAAAGRSGAELAIAAGNTEAKVAAKELIRTRLKEGAGTFIASMTPELAEEFEQQFSDMVIENIAQVMLKGREADVAGIEEILNQSAAAAIEAVPAVLGFGMLGVAGNSVANMKFVINASGHMEALMHDRLYRNVAENNHRANIVGGVADQLDNIRELENKAPEIVTDILDEENSRYGVSDTEVDMKALRQEAGDEVAESVANEAGISQEELAACEAGTGLLSVKTSALQVLCAKLDTATRKKVFRNICAPGAMTNKQAGEALDFVREAMAAIKSKNDKDAAASIDSFVKGNFSEEEQETARDIISTSIDHPLAEARRRLKLVQEQIDEALGGTIEALKKDYGQGVDIVDTEAGKTMRVSNNAPWARAFYADRGRWPNRYELEELAVDVLTNTASRYNPEAVPVTSAEEAAYNEELKNTLAGLIAQRDMYESIAEKLKDIEPGDIIATATLSPEARRIYTQRLNTLKKGNKEVSTTARAAAILSARMADRLAEYAREAGQEGVTALDFATRVIPNATEDAAGGLMQEVNEQISAVEKAWKFTKEYKELLAPNGKKSNLSKRLWLLVRTPAFKKWFGDWDLIQAKEKLDKVVPMPVKTGKEISDQKKLKDIFDSLETPPNNETKDIIHFSKETAGKVIGHKGSKVSTIVDYLPELYKTAIFAMREPEIRKEGHKPHNNIRAYHHYINKFSVGEETYYIRFTLYEENTRKPNKDRLLHSTAISDIKVYPEIKKDGSSGRFHVMDVGVKSEPSFIDNKISQIINSVNSSKVVDENGEPKVMYHGYTPSGERKYLAHTLANVSKYMKAQGRQAGESFSYGLGSFRALLAPKATSIKQIRKWKDRLVNKEEFKKVKEELGKEFDKYVELASGKYDWDVGEARLAEAAQSRQDIPSFLEKEYGISMSEETANDLRKFVQKLAAMPTEYFETKFERPVMLNEFAGALIPKNLPNDLKEELRKSVEHIYEYDENENRTEALAKATRDLAQRRSVLFQSARGAYSTAENIIRLFDIADQSTFMHEISHAYLEDLKQLAAQFPDSQAAKDYAVIMAWAGWQEGQAREYAGTASAAEFMRREAEIQAAIAKGDTAEADRLKSVWAQERFARAFEEYLRSGNAPTTRLQRVFQHFKKWLCDIYSTVTGAGVRATPEVEAVMARMVATDAEIEAAAVEQSASLLAKADPSLLDADATAMLERWTEEAREQAKEKMLKEIIAEYEARDMEAHLAEYREGMRQVFSELPCYQAEAVADEAGEDAVVEIGFYPSIEEWKKDREQYGGPLEEALDKSVEEERIAYSQMMPNREQLAEMAEEALNSGEYAARVSALEAELIARRQKRYEGAPKRLLKAFDDAETAEDTELTRATLALKYATQWEAAQSAEIADLLALADQLRGEAGAAEAQAAEAENKAAEAETRAEAAEAKTAKTEAEKEKIRGQYKKKLAALKSSTVTDAQWLRGVRDATKGRVSSIRSYIVGLMEQMSTKDATNVRHWLMLAHKEAKECANLCAKAAARSSGKRDELYAQAQKAKERQTMYELMAREALKLRKELQQTEGLFKRRNHTVMADKSHAIGIYHKYYLQHLLYAYGFRNSDAIKPSELNYDGFMKTLSENIGDNPDSAFAPPDWLRAAMLAEKPVKNYKALTVAELRDLKVFINFLYTTGKHENTLISTGERVDDIVKTMTADFMESVALTPGEKREISSFTAQLLKPEVLLKILGKKGTWTKYLYKILFDAMDKKRIMQESEAERITALFDKYYDRKIRAQMCEEEIAEFAGQKLTKENILAMALNWGNAGNRGRLVAGLSDNGRYNVSEKIIVDEIFKKHMTANDWECVAAIWQHIGQYGDAVNEVVEKCTGSPMKRVTSEAFSIETADGKTVNLAGGYYPIRYDPERSTRQQEHDLTTMADAIGGAAAFGTGMGSTKERSARTPNIGPLLLNLDVLSDHINQQIHIATMRIACRDVYKLLNNRQIKQLVADTYGAGVYSQLKSWCENTWQEPLRENIQILSILGGLRAKTVSAIMAYRMSTAILNIANIAPMADRIGAVNTVAAMCHYLMHPQAVRRFVLEDSSFMRDRAHNIDRDLNKQQKNLFGGTGKIRYAIDKYANWLIEETDMLCSVPLYYWQYQQTFNEHIAAGETEGQAKDAAHFAAHEAVRNVFGSADIIDQAKIQRVKDEGVKMLIPFYSFFNAQMNAVWEKYYAGKYSGRTEIAENADGGNDIRAVRERFALRYAGFVTSFAMRFIVMAAVETVIREAMSAAAGDDDKDKRKWYVRFLQEWSKNSIDSALGGFPILREIVPAAEITAFLAGEKPPRNLSRGAGVAQAAIGRFTDIVTEVRKGKADAIDIGRTITKAVDSLYGIPDTLTDAIWNTARVISDNHRFNNPDDLREYIARTLLDKKLKKK